jgi:hypothetical protein
MPSQNFFACPIFLQNFSQSKKLRQTLQSSKNSTGFLSKKKVGSSELREKTVSIFQFLNEFYDFRKEKKFYPTFFFPKFPFQYVGQN